MNTKENQINRLAKHIKNNNYTFIGNEEFVKVGNECNVDPYSFDKYDIEKLEKKLMDNL